MPSWSVTREDDQNIATQSLDDERNEEAAVIQRVKERINKVLQSRLAGKRCEAQWQRMNGAGERMSGRERRGIIMCIEILWREQVILDRSMQARYRDGIGANIFVFFLPLPKVHSPPRNLSTCVS